MDTQIEPLDSKRAKELVDIILSTDDPLVVEALLELLNGIIDPHDHERYNAGIEAARHAFTYTKSFKKAFDDYASGNRLADVEHDEDDKPAS
jgi:hypothetical protein